MKKVVPTLLLTLAMLFGKAQTSRSLWFNELIPDAGTGNNEYIEFYNSSRDPIALDCYVVVSYFDKLPGREEAVYIYDFPSNAVIKGLSRYLISSGSPVNFRGGTYTPSDPTSFSNWNSSGAGGSLLKYTYSNGNWGAGESLNTDFNNFIADAGGMDATLFLFKINSDGTISFVNGFVANPRSSDVEALINHLKTFALLPITPVGNCFTSTVNLDFKLITYNNIDIISLIEAPGTGNGYAKKRDGLCGNWEKTSQGEHTPGTSNNFGTVTSNLTTIQDYSCNTVSFSITTNGSTTYPITVQLFYDKPQTGFFEATDEYITSKSVESSASASNTFTVPISSRAVLLVYQTSLGCLGNVAALTTTCSVLPVRLRSFTAARSKQKKEQVVLKWETASEQNNRGFNVQRKVSGEWKNIAFVTSQAGNGNSNTTLSYEYTDINNFSTATQYRLQQVDMDGKSDFSDVRTVLSTEQNGGLVVYPNPGINGKVNVLFKEQNAVKQVIVSDASGRLVKQFPQVKDNNLSIEGLPRGFYTIKVIDRSTMVTSVEKVIIN
ncbi:T9SS type A sorting domain-containing protein [Chitinophagaceae bacterium LB-8]|uniref:T9SS type A sorting domain-containing protein n=1 Tax=Paraflavisolibacter caeni TaxID=2982496 RepID=A0A9X3B645_9BACT|nr:T9SS type A sorting domain-containing protein [Paraflavisolibacter caeni]MCU7547490.1 T9SS type A sorting domain-containing protein [Paraflavisolibacter caeni]